MRVIISQKATKCNKVVRIYRKQKFIANGGNSPYRDCGEQLQLRKEFTINGVPLFREQIA